MGKLGLGKIGCIVVVFCVATAIASSAQTFTTLSSFNGTDGGFASAPLIQGVDGNLYGTTASGGNTSTSCGGCGTVFKVTPSGKITTLYSFCSQTNCADGSFPTAGLVLSSNGNFYGTTSEGGANNNHGTVFEITPQGKLTTIHSFCSQTGCPDGSLPSSGLTSGTDGNFYGTTYDGGPTYGGTAYKISPTGEFTVLYGFCSREGCKDGLAPFGPLILATDGRLYGTTPLGGVTDGGTIFQLTLAGIDTTVHSFSPPNADLHGQANGVMQAADGNLYGTTYEGGSNGAGSAFELTPTGQFTTLYNFCSEASCSDGVNPQSQLVQGTDGNFYGTTSGASQGFNLGTIFRITPAGDLTTLYSFCPANINCADGGAPQAGLLQATNGVFYGVTSVGGSTTNCAGNGCGTVFRISLGLGPFVQANPGFGRAGRVIGILGNNLTGTTGVSFNGVSATFTVVSSTFIKATVPSGATSGMIEVTTPSGTLSSNVAFLVR